MFVPWTEREQHQAALRKGLEALGSDFTAQLCYWCEGTTVRKYESCAVCGRDTQYGCALGLLYKATLKPAPESVVNQVLEAAKRRR